MLPLHQVLLQSIGIGDGVSLGLVVVFFAKNEVIFGWEAATVFSSDCFFFFLSRATCTSTPTGHFLQSMALP